MLLTSIAFLADMSLPTAVIDLLWQISHATAQSLPEKLEPILIGLAEALAAIAFSEDNQAVQPPLLEINSYRNVISGYWQRQKKREQQLEKESQHPENEESIRQIQQEALQDRTRQTELILELLRKWQGEKIQYQLEQLPQIWQKERWLFRLSQTVTQTILRSHREQHRLLILAAPWKISQTCPETFHENLTLQFPDQLERFFHHYYPLGGNSPIAPASPVEFYGSYFPEPIAKVNLSMIQEILAPIPTAILYTNMTDTQMNCHLGFWMPGNSHIAFYPLPSWNWQEAKSSLEAEGIDSVKALEVIQEIAIAIHQVLAAFVADWYYLKINPLSEPRLFHLENSVPENGIIWEWIQPYTHCLKTIQKEQISQIKQAIAPELYREKIRSFQKRGILNGHSSWVDAVAISQDGQIMVSGSYDNTIKLWDLPTGKSVYTLVGHSSTVHSVAISADKKTIVSGSDDGTIKVWNTATGELIRTVKDSASQRNAVTKIQSVSISQDGQKFVSGGDDRTVKIWQLETGKLVQTLHGHSHKVEVVAIAPDNQKIVSGSDDGTIKIWHLETGKLIRTIHGYFGAIYALDISANGQTIVSGHGQKQIKIWQLETGELVRTLYGNFGAVYAVAISPDSKTVATADFLGDSLGHQTVAIQLWDIATGELIHTLPEYSNRILALCFSPDGKTLISASEDKTIKIWQCD
jgi:WD40 repeat protein